MNPSNQSLLLKKAPDFESTDFLGNSVELKSYKGQRIMLSFFRGASCPFCNMRVRELIMAEPEFEENGIQVIAVFASTAAEITEYAGKQNAPFPIIPDPQMELYSLYGVESSPKGMLRIMLQPLKMMKMLLSGFFNLKSINDDPILPADFLIDAEQKIIQIYQGKDFGDHIPISKVLDWK